MRKKTVLTGALFSLVSFVSGQGYGRAVNRTLNPESMSQVRVFYEFLGWPVAGVVAVPLLAALVVGYFLGEWSRENYWVILFTYLIIGSGAVVLLPLVLLNL